MDKIVLTIGIPTYNRENYIVKAVESALNQEGCNVEVIVCDNASNDNTAQLLNKFTIYNNFKYIRNEFNIGPVANYNKCLEHASGKYFMLLGDDDWLSPNYGSLLLNSCKGEDVIFLGKCVTIDQNDNLLGLSSDLYFVVGGNEYIKLYLSGDKRINRHAWFMLAGLTETFRSEGGFPYTHDGQHSDNILMLKMILGRKVIYNPDAIDYYRVHSHSYGNASIYSVAIASMQFYSIWLKDIEPRLRSNKLNEKSIATLRSKLINQLTSIYLTRVIKYGPEKYISRPKLFMLFPYKSWLFRMINMTNIVKVFRFIYSKAINSGVKK